MTYGRLIDITIGVMLALLIMLSALLVYMYVQPQETLAQAGGAPKTYAHPKVDGRVIGDMTPEECMACHAGHLL